MRNIRAIKIFLIEVCMSFSAASYGTPPAAAIEKIGGKPPICKMLRILRACLYETGYQNKKEHFVLLDPYGNLNRRVRQYSLHAIFFPAHTLSNCFAI